MRCSRFVSSAALQVSHSAPRPRPGPRRAGRDGVLDLALCMSVNPGWGGQKLIQGSYDKPERTRAALPAEVTLQVDGGIQAQTIGRCAASGANLFVAGSAVFGADDPAAAYTTLTAAAGAA
ncbi:MAG: hypothetical protein ACYC91_02980 [Solirubrobacteraceae bacterium]